MTIQNSTAVRNAMLDAWETAIGASAKLQIRTGAQPANCAAASTGTLLVEMTLPADWMAAAASAVKSLLGSWSGTAVGDGTAAHYRLLDSAGTTCHEQGSVTLTGGGGDIELDNTSILTGQTVSIASFDRTAGNP